MDIWRCHLKTAGGSGKASQVALERGVIGVGWQVDGLKDPHDWASYYALGQQRHAGEHDRWRRTVAKIHDAMKVDDLVYMRSNGVYYVGRITGEWMYMDDLEARSADLANVRPCDWHQIGLADSVPGNVIRSFVPRRTIQRVTEVLAFSTRLYNRLSGTNYYAPLEPSMDVFTFLGPEACEDVVLLYLFLELGYMPLLGTRRRDTPTYEVVLVHLGSGERAAVQVKSGGEPLDRTAYENFPTHMFLFSAKSNYLGKENQNVTCLDPSEVKSFMSRERHRMPRLVQDWLDWWGQT